jgi:hypothetical protein
MAYPPDTGYGCRNPKDDQNPDKDPKHRIHNVVKCPRSNSNIPFSINENLDAERDEKQ